MFRGGYRDAERFKDAQWLIDGIFETVYCFHMPFFFMLSGFTYFLAYFSREGKPRYEKIKVQMLNLLVIYLLFSEIYGIMRIFLERYAAHETTVRDLFMVWAKPIAEYWYLYVLFFLYLLFLIPKMIRQNPYILFAGTLLLCMVSGYFSGIWQMRNILYYSFYFCTGILLAKTWDFLENKVFMAVSAAVGAVLFLIFEWSGRWESAPQPIRIMAAFGISKGIWLLMKEVPVIGENRFLKFCGQNCLEIYLLHGYFTAGNRTLLPMMGIREPYISIVLNFLISLFVPLLMAWLAKKVGIYNLLFRPAYFLKEKRNGKGKDETFITI